MNTTIHPKQLGLFRLPCVLLSAICLIDSPRAMASGLVELDDKNLREAAGQALFNTNYTAPNQAGNPNPNIGVYRLGIDANLELNANIRKLALGCNGVNGASCDIEIDDLRLSGFAIDADKRPINDRGPETSLLARNPFFEFAIRNPEQASTREVVGLRLGFAEAFGLLSAGNFNGAEGNAASQNNPANHSGIRSLAVNINQVVLNDITIPVTICSGGVNANRTGCGVLSAPVTTAEARILQNTPTNGDNRYQLLTTNLNGRATTRTGAQTFASIQNFGGTNYQRLQLQDVRAVVSGLGGLNLGLLGPISNNIGLNVTFNEALNFLHQIPFGADNNSNGVFDAGDTTAKDFYFSLSSLGDNNVNNSANWLSWQSAEMPGTWTAASRGWSIGVSEARLEGFETNRVFLSALEAIGGAVNAAIPITNVDLQQRPVDNCFGGMSFC